MHEAIRSAARRLGNTPAVTRRAYVHPIVVSAYLDGTLTAAWKEAESAVEAWPDGLSREEAILLAVLTMHEERARAA